MDEFLNNIPLSVRYEIRGLIYSGGKIAAIKRYREAANCDLKTAKEIIENFTAHLKATNPAAFPQATQGSNKVFQSILSVVVVAGLVYFIAPKAFTDDWRKKLDALVQGAKQEAANTPVAPLLATRPRTEAEAPAGPVIDHASPYVPVAPSDPKASLTTLYMKKLNNPEYEAWMSQPGLPTGYQDFPEERQIKYASSEIARNLILPDGVKTLTIPVVPEAEIAIDGAIQHQEWLHAAKIKLEPTETGSTLYLQADKDWLYLAADVPGDTTREGYDQFRFYIHVDIDPAIKNERIHVSPGRPEALGGIRETRIKWQGGPPQNKDENWKKYPVADWRIYRLATGASTLEQHRQFEAKLNLAESGLTLGKPFPVFVEVETDPLTEEKHRTRRYLGKLGNQNQPVWMIMK